jgi:ATP-binding cassette subfamily B (MDR/TAP) protein 1
MTTTSESKFSETDEKSTSSVDEEQEPTPQAGWKALFSFTTTSHIAILISALASAAAAAAILPIFSVIYGLVSAHTPTMALERSMVIN